VTAVVAALHSRAGGGPVLDTAVALADFYDSTVTAVHVGQQPSPEVAELARAAGIELKEVGGSPIEQIVTAAQDPDVAALVLGARGARGGPAPAGHTALEVITRVPKPVAVVPPGAQPSKQIKRILVPIEGTIERSRALDETMGLADRHGLEVFVLHVHSETTVPAFSDHAPYASVAWEQEFVARYLSAPREHITFLRRLGTPADDVVAVARETSPDLIILTWSQHLGRGRARVVSQTLAHSDIPVLLLPSHSDATCLPGGRR
jgi:nucleotide-binding universal stress UspA family protein